MSWKDRLRPASFRGVEFFVESDEAEFGRRQVTHTAALVDVPTLEDLGRAARSFQVEGYLLGDDFDVQLKELIRVIEEVPGPGRLVHPRYGERSVGASGFRVRHQNSEGRMCRFAISFGEAGELSQPTEGVDSVNVLASRSEEIQEVGEQSFSEKFKAADFPQFVRDSAAGTLNTVGEYLSGPAAFITDNYNEATAVFGAVTETVDAVSDTISSYQRQVSKYIGNITSLINIPGNLASTLTGLVGGIRRSYGSGAGAMLSGLVNLFKHEPANPSSSYKTPSRAQIAQNQAAIVQIIRQSATAELAVVAVDQEYETVDEAIEARDVVADLLDVEAEATTSDPMYQQLTQARAELVQGLPSADVDYATLVPYSPASTLPALVIAQTLYGDGNRADQIVTKNDVRHPGFVSGGQTLQVLSDA